MALLTTTKRIIPFAGELTLPVYCRICEIRGTMKSMAAQVEMLHNSSSGEEVSCTTFSFMPVDSSDNLIRQAYLHLKTLPEFADAVDC